MRKCTETTAMPVLFVDPLWLKSQLSLFANAGRGAVQHPGSRGGQYHVDEHGAVRYGDAQSGGYRTSDQAAAAAHHRGEVSSRFTLDPPEVGETRSGKAIPHHEDPNAYHATGEHKASAFKGWSTEDHRDAAEAHDKYARYFAARGRTELADGHGRASKHHAQTAEPANAVPEHVKLPPPLKEHVQRHLDGLHHHAKALEHGRQTDRQFGGGGRYEHDVWYNNGVEAAVEGHHKALAEFHHHAPKNGVDADKVLRELGGVPEVKLSAQAEQHRRR